MSKIAEKFHDNGQLRSRKYKLHGMLHRTDGPAWEEWGKNGVIIFRSFWVNDQLHRTDGPAREWRPVPELRMHGEFYVNDEYLTEEDFRAWQQRQRELAALVFAMEHKFPADAPEREFLRHILPAFVVASRPL